ncbi:CRISPR-associated helicase Cas3, subtype Dpsyc [Nannocystis exedens]|uniref:CRISPR-associated helicase Cas3, subtype Dpsyc n=1 Tax=Nannocystis exedens TaxID=54 RepID=A0A1I2IBD5_9BACT|nr:type I-U CRISPR-associated helicase/endonuclease Cas3 [Nannocystis exedens]PCC68195.1 type I-U CRISPR-associated helicase/endonuclease Cas3 [Nannocystis exedens]SFF39605.1 CRISPR-associated helicase Cas3, subtype Dpsyc [Nannocystis exedens]
MELARWGAGMSGVIQAPARDWLATALGVAESFPWQDALLTLMLAGALPRAVDVPTGLGKTATMAIWLVARAAGATLPRRLVYVVDRRAVIDQASDIARGLRELVARTPSLAAGLGLTPGATLPISTLRGQFADNREWLVDPSSAAIVLGTVDMVGSRLLFEGYGVTRRMRPYHAGLLGSDTLVILDEAHLVPTFEALVEELAISRSLGPRDEVAGLVPRLQVMSLSATGRVTGDVLTLGANDEAHPVVRRRLGARKSLVVRAPVDPATLVEELAREAWERSERGTRPLRCIVFCDQRTFAQAVVNALQKLAAAGPNSVEESIEVELFVGGRRVWERKAAADWLAARGFLAGHRAAPSRPTFVVATSAGEVGVDLDADDMICDLVAWERMVQRLGRVNRRGDSDATIIVVPVKPDKKAAEALAKADRAAERAEDTEDDGPVEAVVRRHRRLDACRELLDRLPRRGGAADVSPGALTAFKQRPDVASLIVLASTPPPLRPALERPLADAWSMTSLVEHTGRPPIQPWLRGWVDEDEPQTTLVWRRHLPVHSNGDPLAPSDVARFFEAAAPYLLEALETETRSALAWLEQRLRALRDRVADRPPPDALVGTDEQAADEAPPTSENNNRQSHTAGVRPLRGKKDVVAFILRANAEPVALRLHELNRDKRERDELEQRLRGSTLVVDVRLGGLGKGLLDPDSDAAIEVGDVEEMAKERPFRVLLREVSASGANDPNNWREELRLGLDPDPEGTPRRWLLVETSRRALPATEEARSTGREQLLAEHEAWVERHARRIGERVGLPPAYCEVLALAALLHDEGKRARRWQQAFRARAGEVWGKTASAPNFRLLDGYRHEFGSLPYAERDPRVAALDLPLRDLCLHLIAAHHGHARPLIPTAGCEDAPPSALTARAAEVALRFTRLQAQWGPWGLAWWESLLRAADQQASRENDQRSDEHG